MSGGLHEEYLMECYACVNIPKEKCIQGHQRSNNATNSTDSACRTYQIKV